LRLRLAGGVHRTQDALIPAEDRLVERIGQGLLAAGLRNLLILHSLLSYIDGTIYGSIKHRSFRATFIRGISMANIDVPVEILEQFCTKNRIKKLSLFGSILRNDFRQESDIDVLVEFQKNGVPGLLGISIMERELSQIFGGRKIDLRTPEDLSKYFRQQVLSTAEVQYAA
jgi:predicted nucleotidyltransferase